MGGTKQLLCETFVSGLSEPIIDHLALRIWKPSSSSQFVWTPDSRRGRESGARWQFILLVTGGTLQDRQGLLHHPRWQISGCCHRKSHQNLCRWEGPRFLQKWDSVVCRRCAVFTVDNGATGSPPVREKGRLTSSEEDAGKLADLCFSSSFTDPGKTVHIHSDSDSRGFNWLWSVQKSHGLESSLRNPD